MENSGKFQIPWCIPKGIVLKVPFIYLIVVISAAGNEYRYVGKGRSPSRLRAYDRNVNRALKEKPSRPLIKKNGEPQSASNVKYRHVHLVLTKAAKERWRVEGRVIKNCPEEEHKAQERFYMQECNCNMNDGESWFVEEFADRAAKIQ